MSGRSQVSSVLAGDESAFTELAERHRRELHVHCYRMLASGRSMFPAFGLPPTATDTS
jgi:DNA-directed RNA polymerase specialized sigma24 family protein